MASLELRDRGRAEEWLGAGLCLMRLEAPSAAELVTVSPWVLATQAEVGVLPPVGVVADIGRLVTTGTRDFATQLPTTDARLKNVVRLYEDQVLGRLASDTRMDAAADAVARLPIDLKREAVAILVSSILQRVKFDAGVSISPGIARGLIQRPGDDILRGGFARLRAPDDDLVDSISDAYERLVRATRHAGALLTDADVFALENLQTLRSLTQRLAVQQMVEVAEELEKTLPRRIKRRAPGGNRTPTNVEDEDQYPIGGFSSMSTQGSIENLVTSELIYMEDPVAGDSDHVDLFDMRYVEGELLYYTRDESVFVRSRRVISFVLPPELSEARFKDPGVRWQRLVIVLGLILCLVRRVSEWLSEEGLLFRVVFLRDAAGGMPLAPERELCDLLLREWIEKGTVEIVDALNVASVVAESTIYARTAQTDIVAFSLGHQVLADVDKRVQALVLDVGSKIPLLHTGNRPAEPPESVESVWSEWTDLLKDLVTLLV